MALMWIIHLKTFKQCLQRLIAHVISGQRGLRFTLIFFLVVVRGLKRNQFIAKSLWPGSQINQLVRVHRELSGVCADFRDSSGSDDDDAGDDDGGGTVVVEGVAAAPSSCHTNLWLNSGCVCPTGFFLTPKLSHAFWSPLLPSFRPTTTTTTTTYNSWLSNLHKQWLFENGWLIHSPLLSPFSLQNLKQKLWGLSADRVTPTRTWYPHHQKDLYQINFDVHLSSIKVQWAS